MIFFGEKAFASALSIAGEPMVSDARSAMRCIAFELPTAAAFHLHRLNEAVLGLYWDSISDRPRPQQQTLGSYLSELRKIPDHDTKVVAALDQIRNLHRNPTVHADYTFQNIEEAIALYGMVTSVVTYMLGAVSAK